MQNMQRGAEQQQINYRYLEIVLQPWPLKSDPHYYQPLIASYRISFLSSLLLPNGPKNIRY